MPTPEYRRSQFDQTNEDTAPLINLADVMLVFAVGLMVALAASEQGAKTSQPDPAGGVVVEAGRELPEMPAGLGESGLGYEAVGRVFRDQQTGRLILIDD